MTCVLELRNGCEQGRRTWIRFDQVLRVGGTEWADFAIRGDGSIAAVHFQIENSSAGVSVTDLCPESGTFVNHRRIESERLRDGDLIHAGETCFQVSIQSADRSQTAHFGESLSGRNHGRMDHPKPASSQMDPRIMQQWVEADPRIR